MAAPVAPAVAAAAVAGIPAAGAVAGAVAGAGNAANSPLAWLRESNQFALETETEILESIERLLAGPAAAFNDTKRHHLVSLIQQIGLGYDVPVPFRVVIGNQSAGKTRYVEYLLNGLPVGYSAAGRATVQPIAYMLRYSPRLGAAPAVAVAPVAVAGAGAGAGAIAGAAGGAAGGAAAAPVPAPAAAGGGGAAPAAAAAPAAGGPVTYDVRVKERHGTPWTAAGAVSIGSLGHYIADIQDRVLNSPSQVSNEWLLVSILTNDPHCRPVVVVDCPGIIGANPIGRPSMIADLMRISSVLLTEHRNNFRLTVVADLTQDPAQFLLFQQNHFNANDYDTVDETGLSRLSLVLTHGDLACDPAVAHAARQVIVDRIADYQGVTALYIPVCICGLQNPEPYPANMTLQEVAAKQTANMQTVRARGAAIRQYFAPLRQPLVAGGAERPLRVSMTAGRAARDLANCSFDLDEFQREEDQRYILLVRQKLGDIVSKFADKRAVKREALAALERYGHLADVSVFASRMSKFCDKLAVMAKELYDGTRKMHPSYMARINGKYTLYGGLLKLTAQCNDPLARQLAQRAWLDDDPTQTDQYFTGLVDQADTPIEQGYMQYQRLCVELRVRGIAQRAPFSPDYPTNQQFINHTMAVGTGLVSPSAPWQLALAELNDGRITAAFQYRLARVKHLLRTQFAMAYDILEAAGEIDFIALPPQPAGQDALDYSALFRSRVLQRVENILLHQWIDQFLSARFSTVLQTFNAGGFTSWNLALYSLSSTFILNSPVNAPPPAAPLDAAGLATNHALQIGAMAATDVQQQQLLVTSVAYIQFNAQVYSSARQLFRLYFNYLSYLMTMEVEKELQSFPISFIRGPKPRLIDDLKAALLGPHELGAAVPPQRLFTHILADLVGAFKLPPLTLPGAAAAAAAAGAAVPAGAPAGVGAGAVAVPVPTDDMIPLHAGSVVMNEAALSAVYDRDALSQAYNLRLARARDEFAIMDRFCLQLLRARNRILGMPDN